MRPGRVTFRGCNIETSPSIQLNTFVSRSDILDFSKIEARKLLLETVEFGLTEGLEDTMKSFALRAHQKGLELACHLQAGIPERLLGDPMRLRQIIVNLVGNAIKFTSRGEVVVCRG